MPEQPDVPLIGFTGELSDRQGIDLIARILLEWAENRLAQWVFLGRGDPGYEHLVAELAERYPHRVAARIDSCDSLAHRITAGSDIVLVPRQSDPCERRQLRSLRYGTVPVVRAAGVLADTVTDVTADTVAAGTATGFHFREYSEVVMEEALGRACNTFSAHPGIWDQLVARGMREDWSWSQTARQYADLYRKTVTRHKRTSLG